MEWSGYREISQARVCNSTLLHRLSGAAVFEDTEIKKAKQPLLHQVTLVLGVGLGNPASVCVCAHMCV